MASRMNSGGSNDLSCIRIDPRTGEKFSGYSLDSSKDIAAAATAWQHPQQCTFIHTHSCISSNGRRVCYCTVHYVIVDQ